MNPAALQKIISDAVNQNVFENWRFYVLLVSVAFLTCLFNALVEGWGKKKGEIAATKEDLDEIKRQLAETTEVTKTVETAVVRGDWIQREKNVLKRTKLEALVRAAFTTAAWSRDVGTKFTENNQVQRPDSIDELRMLAILYFPELKVETDKISIKFSEFTILLATVRNELLRFDNDLKTAEIYKNSTLHSISRRDRTKYANSQVEAMVQATHELTMAAFELGDAAHAVMEQLTTNQAAI